MTALAGRTVQVVKDISKEEQLYLYERARRLKEARVGSNGVLSPAQPLYDMLDADVPEQVADPDATVYLLFMEGSTRTKESFRNAAAYHDVKVNEFQAETSSFQKNETMCDTIKMLTVYSLKRSVFVIRSPLEGVCRWLETALPKHAERFGVPTPSFLNAGDGAFTHPLAEYADIFSLLELSKWNRTSIHIALVGDLAHGRTAHSKSDGLAVFDKVCVDLIAPTELAYPVEYENKMRENNFTVRKFQSIEEYLQVAADSVANLWHFFRPRLSRCGDLPKEQLGAIWASVSFKEEWSDKLPEGTRFMQTLPRDTDNPQIPLSFDITRLNAWDSVVNNAYYLNIVLIGALHGAIGKGLPDPDKKVVTVEEDEELNFIFPLDPTVEVNGKAPSPLPDFIENVNLKGRDTQRRPGRALGGGSTVPLKDGLVIDHIGLGASEAEAWKCLRSVRSIVGWSNFLGSEGVYPSTSKEGSSKGIMHFPMMDLSAISALQLQVLASIAPGCTVNAIVSSTVVRKFRLRMPVRIQNLPNISCKNNLCVSHPSNKQRDVFASFERVKFYTTSALPAADSSQQYLFVCRYCSWPHQYRDIWVDTN